MIRFPAPEQIHGEVLIAEIEAAGFTGVHAYLDDHELVVQVDGLLDPMPSPEEREEAMEQARRAALSSCIAAAQMRADEANSAVAARIGAIVQAHVPPVTDESVAS